MYAYKSFGGVGIDIWQVKSGTVFDNIYIGRDVAEAEKWAEDVWKPQAAAEKAAAEKEEAERKAKEEEERKARAAASPDDDDDDDDDDDGDDDHAHGDEL